jgi:hypothetical protein
LRAQTNSLMPVAAAAKFRLYEYAAWH